jgi:hypothetical protein
MPVNDVDLPLANEASQTASAPEDACLPINPACNPRDLQRVLWRTIRQVIHLYARFKVVILPRPVLVCIAVGKRVQGEDGMRETSAVQAQAHVQHARLVPHISKSINDGKHSNTISHLYICEEQLLEHFLWL